MPEVLMPRLSDSMEEGTIVRWLKSDGEEVSRGEEIVEIETDKATMSYEADASGRLSIFAPEGATLPVGQAIALIEGANRAPVAASAASLAPSARARSTAPETSSGNGGQPRAPSASPVARRLATALGVAIESLRGSGPYGRILKADVAAAAREQRISTAPRRARPVAPEPVPAAATASGPVGELEIQDLSRAQVIIARRMAESRASVPDFELRAEIEMEDCTALREQLRERTGDASPSLNDFVVKACARALREHPRVNGSYRDGRFELHDRVNVGIAVAAEDALLVPTIFDADAKSLGTIAAEARRLAERVRDATITPPDLTGGTFTVSNLGMFGVSGFSAVINPPQAAILAVGSVAPRPVVRDGAIVVRAVMEVALACDHRILYGSDAARFLVRVRELLEDPLTLLL